MKILLVKPNIASDSITPPLGLGYLAAAIGDVHSVEILNCMVQKISIDKFSQYIREIKPDIVGIQSYTMDCSIVKKYLNVIKTISFNTWTVIGGPHPSSVPFEVMGFFGKRLDFAFSGEAEEGFSQLADILLEQEYPLIKENLLNNIPGLIWRSKDGESLCNKKSYMDLEKIKSPRWDILLSKKYPPAPHAAFMKKTPTAPIIVSRGCPYNCTFCAAHLITGKKIRYRPVLDVIEEIETLHKKFGINEIHIVDDNFTFNKDYVLKFCKELKGLKINISWTCPNGVCVNTLDSELLQEMKSAGCYSISVGIESGNQRILNMLKKGILIETLKEKIELIKDSGLDVIGFFIIGFPSETLIEINNTIRFSLKLGLNKAQFMNFYPLPGTPVFDMLKKSGELKVGNKNVISFAGVNYWPVGLSKKKLKWLQRKAFLCFYCRPKALFSIFKQIQSCKQLWFLMVRIYRYMLTG